jgi:hypothetical protein
VGMVRHTQHKHVNEREIADMSARFSGLKRTAASPPSRTEAEPGLKGREGKKAVVGYFSPNVSRGLRMLAIETNSNVQALLGEAIDELMRKYHKHPFGER